MQFGEKIKLVRTKLNMTQEEFAKEMKVAFVTLNRWENNHFEPKYKVAQALHEICKKHNIDMEVL